MTIINADPSGSGSVTLGTNYKGIKLKKNFTLLLFIDKSFYLFFIFKGLTRKRVGSDLNPHPLF